MQERIHRLWNEVADYPAADHDAALAHLLTVVAELLHAQNAYWVGSVRVLQAEGDALFGWRPSRIRNLHQVPLRESVSGQKVNECAWNPEDEMVVAHARAAGTFSASRFADVVSEAWFRGPRYQRYVAAGITDAIYVHTPVGTRADSMYCFVRGVDFTAKQNGIWRRTRSAAFRRFTVACCWAMAC